MLVYKDLNFETKMTSALPNMEISPTVTHSLVAFQILDEHLRTGTMIKFQASLVEELLFFINSSCIVSQPFSKFMFTESVADGLNFSSLLPGHKADIDIMDVRHFMRVIPTQEDFADEPSLCQFLMESDLENPAYAKLRLISIGNNIYNIPFFCNGTLVETQNGMKYLSSSEIKILTKMCFMCCVILNIFAKLDHISSMTVTGPATSWEYEHLNLGFQNGFSLEKMDQVFSIPCPSWPDVASEWISRDRIHNWPSKAMIRRISSKGCYLVPKSRAESRTKNLKWAISFSHIEPSLIHSMNDVMIKTYVLLKLLQKSVLQTELGDVISSYIIKTAIFWEIEESIITQWIPEKLLDCVRRCLQRARGWLDGNFAPHYFIRDQNLLRQPLAASIRVKAIRCINNTVSKLDDLYQDILPLQNTIRSRGMAKVVRRYYETDFGNKRMLLNKNIAKVKQPLFLLLNALVVPMFIGSFLESHSSFSWSLIDSFSEAISQTFKDQTCTLPRVLILSTLLQKRILLELIFHGNTSSTNKKIYHRKNHSSEISRLSNVTFPVLSMSNLIVSLIRYIYLRDYQKIKQSIDKIERCLRNLVVRVDYSNQHNVVRELSGPSFLRFLLLCKEDNTMANEEPVIINFEFPLTHLELKFLPPILSLELECRFNVDKNFDPIYRPPGENILLVDSEALFYFISFCFFYHGDKNIQKLSFLYKLEYLCRSTSVMHLHVALNLLGYCQLLMERERDALRTFHRSLCIQSKNRDLRIVSKATPFCVAILLHKCFSDEWSKTK